MLDKWGNEISSPGVTKSVYEMHKYMIYAARLKEREMNFEKDRWWMLFDKLFQMSYVTVADKW